VTGHRDVPDEEAVAVRVREALARIRELRPASDATPVALTVVSSLAEGADRLVAREVLAAGGELEVPLPLAVDDYELDFETETSRAEFRQLLERARSAPLAD